LIVRVLHSTRQTSTIAARDQQADFYRVNYSKLRVGMMTLEQFTQ
jgi:hypothetical protein